MSTVQGPTIIPLFAPLVLLARSEIGVVALLVYEYGITFDQELALFWRRKKTGATYLFFATRYVALICFGFLGAATFAPMSNHSCQTLQVLQYSVQTIQYLPPAIFSALRALALSGMNWWLFSCVFVLISSPVFGFIWELTTGVTGVSQPPFGCGGGNKASPRQAIILAAVQCSCTITADILVIIITWWYSIKSRGLSIMRRRTRSYLTDILSLNGTIYFLIFLALNTLQLAFSLISYVYALETVGIVVVFTAPFQAIVTCRFLIALQSADRRVVGGALTSGANADGQDTQAEDGNTLRFASRVVGSIGGDLGTSFIISAADEFDDHEVDDEALHDQVSASPHVRERMDEGVCNTAGPSARAKERRSTSDDTVEV